MAVDDRGCHDSTFSLLSGSPDSAATLTPTSEHQRRRRRRSTDGASPLTLTVGDTLDTEHSAAESRARSVQEELEQPPTPASSSLPHEVNASEVSITSVSEAGLKAAKGSVTTGSRMPVRSGDSAEVCIPLSQSSCLSLGSEGSSVAGDSVALTGLDGQSSRTTISEVEFRRDLASLDADIERLQMQFRVAMQA